MLTAHECCSTPGDVRQMKRLQGKDEVVSAVHQARYTIEGTGYIPVFGVITVERVVGSDKPF